MSTALTCFLDYTVMVITPRVPTKNICFNHCQCYFLHDFGGAKMSGGCFFYKL